MDKAWVVFMEPSLFIWIARTFLKPFVVDNLKMFEKGFAEVASGTTVIHFNTHIATHTATHSHRYNRQCYSDIRALLSYATVSHQSRVTSLTFDLWPSSHFQDLS